MVPRKKNTQIVETIIDKYSKRGNGIGNFVRQDGASCSVEVPFSIPGDRLSARLLEKKSGIYKGLAKELISPSFDRMAPRCKHFGICGGCRWQQISYQQQLQNKQDLVVKYFQNLINSSVVVHSILPCNAYWHYRNKMEFSFSSDKANNHYLGLVMDSSQGKVFNLSECHLPNLWFAATVQTVREWWKESGLEAYHLHKNTGSLQTLTLREGLRTGDRMINLGVSGNPDYALKKHHLESFISTLRKIIDAENPTLRVSIFLTIKQAIKGQPTRFYEMHLYGQDHIRETLHVQTSPEEEPHPLTFKISSSAFFQPNTRQAEKLYSAVLQMTPIPDNGVVYDLYCGTGTLGICMAKKAKQIVGIELSREASLDARLNAKENGMEHVTILTGSVNEKLNEIRRDRLFSNPDVVVIDPPRAGLDPEALQHIIALNPSVISYVSCNPATQAENIAALIDAGYRLTALQPVDQFPHTIHIENIAILQK